MTNEELLRTFSEIVEAELKEHFSIGAALYETDPFMRGFSATFEGRLYEIDITDIAWAEEEA